MRIAEKINIGHGSESTDMSDESVSHVYTVKTAYLVLVGDFNSSGLLCHLCMGAKWPVSCTSPYAVTYISYSYQNTLSQPNMKMSG